MEMEKEVINWEQQAEVEEKEEDETSLLGRKARNRKDGKLTTETAAVGVGESNEVSLAHGQRKIEELDGILEKESETIEGEHKPENLVFYDKAEGIWKCRICSWTYQNGSFFCLDHIQNHKGEIHKLMNVKTLNFESKGVESTCTHNEEKQILKDPGYDNLDISSLDFVVHSTSAIKSRFKGGLENGNFSSSNLEPSQISFQDHSGYYKSSKEIESAEVDLINGDDLEVRESDIERVLQNQTTHELYCPNCNSCITKRVILRKRKRRIRISDEDVKRNREEAAVASKSGIGSVQSPSEPVHHTDEIGHSDTQLPRGDEDEHNRGPNIFRCLSCFSFFIPIGNGLFRIFGGKNGKETVPVEQAPNIEKDRSTSMCAPNEQETEVKQGIEATAGNQDTQEGGDEILPVPRQKPSLNGKVTITVGEKLDVTATETVVSQHTVTQTKLEVHSGEPLKVDNISCSPIAQGMDAVINIDSLSTGSSQVVQGIANPIETARTSQPPNQIGIAGRERTEEGKEFEIEVIKSIVYGGLAESITSLSVVSSAAGGGAATLNILALGMANLIGGLFVIGHNLWELKSECTEQVANQVSDGVSEQRDRYKVVLGRRHNFVVHVIVAIISYLVFGLVPPVAYGLSFSKTNDKQMKLVVVAAASLVCIVVLAMGRAYVRRPPKPYLKSVINFVILGFTILGVSYAAGELVQRLLEKLGVFQSGSVSNILVPERTPTGAAWASY